MLTQGNWRQSISGLAHTLTSISAQTTTDFCHSPLRTRCWLATVQALAFSFRAYAPSTFIFCNCDFSFGSCPDYLPDENRKLKKNVVKVAISFLETAKCTFYSIHVWATWDIIVNKVPNLNIKLIPMNKSSIIFTISYFRTQNIKIPQNHRIKC